MPSLRKTKKPRYSRKRQSLLSQMLTRPLSRHRSSMRLYAISGVALASFLFISGNYGYHILMQRVGQWRGQKGHPAPTTLTLTPTTHTGSTVKPTAAKPSSASAAAQASAPATKLSAAAPQAQALPAQATVTPPPPARQLPYRINPVCVSTHIDRLSASDVDKQTSQLQAMGTNWVRFDVVWASIEQTKGSYNWANYDYDVNAVLSKGMKVMALITQYGLPTWERIDSSNWASTPNNMQDFQNFAQAFAQRYRGKISLYEIGNEPNMSMFWPSGPDPAAYTQVLMAGYKGVKAADSSNKVISAGLANISAASYLQGMYNAGAKDYFDYVGFHPYSWPHSPDYPTGTYFGQTANIRQVMANNGQGAKGIMATEVGWPSTTASGGVDEATQAAYISRLFQKVVYEDYQYVPIVCVYDLINDGTDPANSEDNFGILRADYSPKPAFNSMKAARQDFNAHFAPASP